ncbi:MAG: 3-isopropylmalate dehydratase small subunit [Candidatus Hydrothermarchaeota archaeon]
MERRIKGRVWRFGPNVDTDQIIPAEYLVTGDPKELARHVFEKARPDLAKEMRAGDIIVAEENFGCGSSREHAPRALMGAGISCVIARSFARIFFRNAVNISLPVIEARLEARDGDLLEVDFSKGKIKELATGREHTFKPLPKFLLELMESGGLVEYTKRELARRR